MALAKKKETKKKTVDAAPEKGTSSAASVLETLRSIKTKFGDEAIMTLDTSLEAAKDIKSLRTGSIGLDDILGIGGYPEGRIIEVFGPESSGKTTLTLHAIAEAQKAGGVCAFIDAEHALDPQYARAIGVNLSELLVSQPDTGEQALEITESLVRSGKVALIVIDSVAALTPRDEIEGEMGATHVGKQARLMSQALRKLTAIAHKSGTVIIFINQIRMQIGVMFGNPETTPGGKALKFYTSVRLDIRRIAQIKKGEEVVGGRHKVKVVKNKVAAPFRTTEFDLIYGEGISTEGEMLALGEKFGFVKKSGASYTYIPPGGDESTEVKLGRGYDAARKYLKEDTKTYADLMKNIRTALKGDKDLYGKAPVSEDEPADLEE